MAHENEVDDDATESDTTLPIKSEAKSLSRSSRTRSIWRSSPLTTLLGSR